MLPPFSEVARHGRFVDSRRVVTAPSGAIGRGNRASDNDDPNQCEAADLDCHVP
jgi:hypothetical protein